MHKYNFANVGLLACCTRKTDTLYKQNFFMVYTNLPKYLIDFVKSQSELSDDAIIINRSSLIGSLIYDKLDRVPDGCTFNFEQFQYRLPLKIEIKEIRGKNEKRIYENVNYYITPQNQKILESQIEDYFNNLFFSTLNISSDFSQAKLKQSIEKFCKKFNLDFPNCFDMLTKRYFRHRTK